MTSLVVPDFFSPVPLDLFIRKVLTPLFLRHPLRSYDVIRVLLDPWVRVPRTRGFRRSVLPLSRAAGRGKGETERITEMSPMGQSLVVTPGTVGVYLPHRIDIPRERTTLTVPTGPPGVPTCEEKVVGPGEVETH